MIWIFQGDSKRVIESSNGFLEGHTVPSDVSLVPLGIGYFFTKDGALLYEYDFALARISHR